MTLASLVRTLRKRWLMVVALAVAGVLAAAGATALMPKEYAATSTSFVSLTSRGQGGADLYQNSQFTLTRVGSYPEMVHSPEVLEPVIGDLGLKLTPQQLRPKVTAVNPTGTILLKVQVINTSPELATELANAIADRLGDLIEETETPAAAGAKSPVKVTNVIPARVPTGPASPRPALNLTFGLLLGLALGVAAAVLRERLDTRVRSAADIETRTGSSPLGVIRKDPTLRRRPLVTMTQTGATVEDFRSIRSSLRFVNVDAPPRMIVVASAIAGEGKSVTACNLAITLAHADLNVCLVEADLRRPKVTTYLGIDGSIGLADVVAGDHALDEVLVPWGGGLVSVLPAGHTPPDPSMLLGSKAMGELLARLRARFDMVIIDAPPLLPVSDAAVLGAQTDGVILVAGYGHVKRDQLDDTINMVKSVGATLIGTIINRMPVKQRQADYGNEYTVIKRPERSEPPVEHAVKTKT
ncbi:polysaccharide biosynthesis tyrosine autokinase [Nocardioides speluncae]|uniref:polysaccharide biosynthesis tyrosine autokinase n=1 Tax=Nocardioides speluncae TaxID=2670337 RepID=UPI000D69E243|nr:polysaccharide biosynthesis tyrosine autokinase [Nocardioides speluncae]